MGACDEYGVTPVEAPTAATAPTPTPSTLQSFAEFSEWIAERTDRARFFQALRLTTRVAKDLWSPDPYKYESARIQLAKSIGFEPTTLPNITSLVPSSIVDTIEGPH